MSSSTTFPSAGDLIKVRISACVSSSTPCICNSQLNISTDCRRINSGSSLDCDGWAYSSLKQKFSQHSHLFHSRRREPVAALKKTVGNTSADASVPETNNSESPIRNELSALDAYFTKLQGKGQIIQESSSSVDTSASETAFNGKLPSSDRNGVSKALSQDDSAIKNDLLNVEIYLERLAKGLKKPSDPATRQKYERELEGLMKEAAPSIQLVSVQEMTDEEVRLEIEDPSSSASTESSIVYVLAAVNIAIYLFGLASPVDTSGMGASTLPVLYGAKVNEFLLNGEWWRLITPMFLHSGFFHVVLSSWALLFFGPQVENVFGPLAFCMIYFLGGLCGNMFSFFFTPDATVGGTGPLFALFGAWVVYLWLNKTVLGEKSADYGIKATTLMGVLVLCLSCLLPTDEWIHVGAVLPGIMFGYYASPSLHVDRNGSDVKKMRSGEEAVAIFDSPSVLSLTLGFAGFTTLCFAAYHILAPTVAQSQLVDNVPF